MALENYRTAESVCGNMTTCGTITAVIIDTFTNRIARRDFLVKKKNEVFEATDFPRKQYLFLGDIDMHRYIDCRCRECV